MEDYDLDASSRRRRSVAKDFVTHSPMERSEAACPKDIALRPLAQRPCVLRSPDGSRVPGASTAYPLRSVLDRIAPFWPAVSGICPALIRSESSFEEWVTVFREPEEWARPRRRLGRQKCQRISQSDPLRGPPSQYPPEKSNGSG